MKIYSWAIVSALALKLLTGCSTSYMAANGHPIVGPDGSENEIIACSLVDDCYNFSRQVCVGNYKIVNSTTNAASTGGKYATVYSTINLLVKCDSGKATFPGDIAYSTSGAPTSYSNAEFPTAHSFKDCDQYASLIKDRCRDEVYARSKKTSN